MASGLDPNQNTSQLFLWLEENTTMGDEIQDSETAVEIAEEYADTECVGEFGEIITTEEEDTEWVVEFQTHTFSDVYTHTIRITKSVGNVVSHDRTSRFD